VKKQKTTPSAVDWNTFFSLLVIVALSLLFWTGEAKAEMPPAGKIEQQLKILELVDPQKAQQAREILESEQAKEKLEKDVPRDQKVIPEAATPSAVEKLLTGDLRPGVPITLTQFGYDIFRETVSSFAPVSDVPIGPDYIIGPGDEMTLTLWGMVEGIYKLEVTREGTVILPKVGVVSVAGLRFGVLKENLEQHLSKYYRDFNLNVSLGNLRTIRVYMVGEIQNPGSYILSSLSTLYNALFAAGGPAKSGSLRDIRLIREGKVIAHLDLYEFLLQGDRSQDQGLQTGDTIFIPLIGPVVGVAGNVKRPAIYEFKGRETLGGVLKIAGGVIPTGYLNRVQVERVVRNEKRIVADFDLSEGELKDKGPEQFLIPAQNMDLIKIFSILEVRVNTVYLEGHVTRPGSYELKEGMRISDLIPSFEQLLPQAYFPHGEIIRLVPPDLHPETKAFDLGGMLAGDQSHNPSLQALDRVMIFSMEQMKERPMVVVSGYVQRPGPYPMMENMTVRDLVFKAGNVTRNAFLDQAELVRTLKEGSQIEQKRIPIVLSEAMLGDQAQNIKLQEDDHLFIREIPEWFVNKSITLTGELRFPGAYAFKKGERLSDVIERAGGFTDRAYLPGAVFTRLSVGELEKKQLDLFLTMQKQRLATEAASIAASGLEEKEVQAEALQLSQRKQSLDLLVSQVQLGRVVIHLKSMEAFTGTESDIVLEDKDTLFVPLRPSSVAILGSIRNPTSFLFEEKKRVDFYIQKAGGYMEDAEKKGVYIVRADGSATSLGHLVYLEPGDAVIIPTKIEAKYRPIPLWRDIATIVGQFALTVAALATIF